MASSGLSHLPSTAVNHETYYNLTLRYQELQDALEAKDEELRTMKSKKSFYKAEAIKWRSKSKFWKEEAEHQQNMRNSCWYRINYRFRVWFCFFSG